MIKYKIWRLLSNKWEVGEWDRRFCYLLLVPSHYSPAHTEQNYNNPWQG
jgi:hypothetical protein